MRGVILIALILFISSSTVHGQVNVTNGSSGSLQITPLATYVIPAGFETTGKFPSDARAGSVLYLFSIENNYMITGTTFLNFEEGIFFNNDLGSYSRWLRIPGSLGPQVFQLPDGKIINIGRDRILILKDDRSGWLDFSTFPKPFSGLPSSFLETRDGKYIVGSQGNLEAPNVYVSTNKGVSWQSVNYGLPDGRTYVLDLIEASDGYVYAASYGQGVYRTIDGIAWENVYSSNTITTITETNDGKLLIADYSGILSYSTDNGVSWTYVKTLDGIPNKFYKLPSGEIYLGTSSGLWKSDASGLNWQKLFTADDAGVTAITLGKDGRLYVGAPGIDDINSILRSLSIVGTTTTSTTSSSTTSIPEFFTREEVMQLLSERDAKIAELEGSVFSIKRVIDKIEETIEEILDRLDNLPPGLRQQITTTTTVTTTVPTTTVFPERQLVE